MIVIAYDGSDDARAAIGQAAKLMPGHPALVLCVVEPVDRANRDQTQTVTPCASEGVQVAREFGIDCSASTRTRIGTVAATILAEAERLDAGAIVVGRHGLSSSRSPVMGSVSQALLAGARCAVLVAADPEVQAGLAERDHAWSLATG